MKKDSDTTTGGIGFTGALFLVFLVLKLTNIIDWSWWWVAAPLWIHAILVLVLIAAFVFKEYIRRKY